ncbi:hypothetical protein ACFL52_04165 [Candidatus Margulisiibacteriota bacterium]
MKKIITLLLVMAFVVGLVSIASAASPAKIKAYINLLERKLDTANQNQNWARAAKLKRMIAVQKNRLGETESIAAPPPPPVAAPKAPAKMTSAEDGPYFGLGMPVCGSVGYLANRSVLSARADVLLPEPLGLGSYVGLPAESVMYRIGLGYFSGEDQNMHMVRGVPVYLDGVILLPANLLDGIESYIGAGINYLVLRTGNKSGTLGGQVYFGIQGNFGLGGLNGKSFAQIGYKFLRSGVAASDSVSCKGISLQVGQSIIL